MSQTQQKSVQHQTKPKAKAKTRRQQLSDRYEQGGWRAKAHPDSPAGRNRDGKPAGRTRGGKPA